MTAEATFCVSVQVPWKRPWLPRVVLPLGLIAWWGLLTAVLKNVSGPWNPLPADDGAATAVVIMIIVLYAVPLTASMLWAYLRGRRRLCVDGDAITVYSGGTEEARFPKSELLEINFKRPPLPLRHPLNADPSKPVVRKPKRRVFQPLHEELLTIELASADGMRREYVIIQSAAFDLTQLGFERFGYPRPRPIETYSSK